MTRRLAAMSVVAALLLAGACASPSKIRATLPAPDSTGLAVLDCEVRFDLKTNDSRKFDQYLTTGMDRLARPLPAQNAFYSSSETPDRLMPARSNRGLLLLGPLPPGTYFLARIGTDREFIEVVKNEGVEYVRDPAVCKLGTAGTSRIGFVVEPGGVTYIGQMTLRCDLRAPEVPESRLSETLYRAIWTADDRTWVIGWDRAIRYEIAAWERLLVGLKKTPWREPIEGRLAFLRTQAP